MRSATASVSSGPRFLFDGNDIVRFVAWRGLSDAYRAAVDGHSPWTPDSPDPQPICVADVEGAPDLASYRATFSAEVRPDRHDGVATRTLTVTDAELPAC